MIEDILARCGLNSSDQKVLLHLLIHGKSTVKNIDKNISVKRTAIYAVLDNLIELGLIMKDSENPVHEFQTIPSHLIPDILESHARKNYEDIVEAVKVLRMYIKEIHDQKAESMFQVAIDEDIEKWLRKNVKEDECEQIVNKILRYYMTQEQK